MNGVVITGLGSVSPVGVGSAVLSEALRNNISGIKKITKFPVFCEKPFAGEINDFKPEDFIKDNRFRRIADISKYAIAAGLSSVRDGDIDLKNYAPDRVGLIMCITHGAIGYSGKFHRELLDEGSESASPMLFSDSVLNAPAGNVSNYLGIKGPVHTLVGGSGVPIEAIRLAEDLLLSGRIDCCFVGAAEELNEIAFHTYRRFGFDFSPGEGAGMVILERQDNALRKKQKVYAAVRGNVTRFYHKNSKVEPLIDIVDRCLKKTGFTTGNIDGIFVNTDSAADAIKRLCSRTNKETAIKNMAGLLGEAFCVTTVFHIIVAAMLAGNGFKASKNMVIGAVSLEGKNSSLILSGMDGAQGG